MRVAISERCAFRVHELASVGKRDKARTYAKDNVELQLEGARRRVTGSDGRAGYYIRQL